MVRISGIFSDSEEGHRSDDEEDFKDDGCDDRGRGWCFVIEKMDA